MLIFKFDKFLVLPKVKGNSFNKFFINCFAIQALPFSFNFIFKLAVRNFFVVLFSISKKHTLSGDIELDCFS